MGRRTALAGFVGTVQREIERACDGQGGHRKRAALERELVEVLAGGAEPDKLLQLRVPRRMFVETEDRRLRLGASILAMVKHRASPQRAAHETGTALADITLIKKLAPAARSSLETLAHRNQNLVSGSLTSYFEKLAVVLDQRALEDLLLAAIEAYKVPPARRGARYTEIAGYCFGSRRDLRVEQGPVVERIVSVSRIVTQMRAWSTASEVEYDLRSERVHFAVHSEFFNHLEMVGDYHTHPYRDLSTLRRIKGWEYSKGDASGMEAWARGLEEGGARPRFSLIVALARGGRRGRSVHTPARNRLSLCVDDMFIEIGAYRIRRDYHYDDDLTLRLGGLGRG